MMPPFLSSPADLVTTREATRAGFIEVLLEKNRRATPYIAQAQALRAAVLPLSGPDELRAAKQLGPFLLVAAGVSDKAASHLDATDKVEAIRVLIAQFLEPAGASWRDELVFRFLLTRGDTLGGEMRNAIGTLGERKLARALIAALQLRGEPFSFRRGQLREWEVGQNAVAGVETELNGLFWRVNGAPRTLIFNVKGPSFTKNIDLCLIEIDPATFAGEKSFKAALKTPELHLAFGELKSGFDPAGADEHWKTAQSALFRIRDHYAHNPKTFFLGAAIVPNMAREIWSQLESGTLDCAANLTREDQLAGLCAWLIGI